jgi:hypothetical protein
VDGCLAASSVLVPELDASPPGLAIDSAESGCVGEEQHVSAAFTLHNGLRQGDGLGYQAEAFTGCVLRVASGKFSRSAYAQSSLAAC